MDEEITGEPITLDTAVGLRQVLFGTSSVSCKFEWIMSGFIFNAPGTTFSYGLIAPKGSTKGVIMCVQAYVLKHLMFQNRSEGQGPEHEEGDLMEPSGEQQEESLRRAIADIIWKCGAEKEECIACIDSNQPYVSGDVKYAPDGVTEKLLLFKFTSKESLLKFLEEKMHHFQEECRGAILKLVYSAVLTRGIEKVMEDQSVEQRPFVSNIGELHVSLLSLLLTGTATSFLHNGTTSVDGISRLQQVGVLSRSELGLLYYRKDDNSKEVGSRMKTPMYPVWLTSGNDQYGVLFNPSRDLLRDHKAEHVFNLLYYSSTPEHSKTVVLTLDTRSGRDHREEELKKHVLEKLILSKWQGATVNWNGATPSMQGSLRCIPLVGKLSRRPPVSMYPC